MLVFVDESGYPVPTDSTLRPTLVAVCIRESDLRDFTRLIYQVKLRTIGDTDYELKASDGIVERTVRKNLTNKRACYSEVVDVLAGFNVGVFAVIMQRPDSPPEIPDGIVPIQFRFLLDRVNAWCRKQRETGIVIFDTRADSKMLSKAFYGFLYKSEWGRSLDFILELPLFVDSATTPGIQVADVVAGVVRHFEEIHYAGATRDPRFAEWIDSLYPLIEGKTCNFTKSDGRVDYGFYRMPTRFFQHRSIDP